MHAQLHLTVIGLVLAGLCFLSLSAVDRSAAQTASPTAAGWDLEKAHEQCANFVTYGMAEEGVYGPWFQAMYDYYGWADCNRTDNDLGSAEVIAAYEAEKNNPQARSSPPSAANQVRRSGHHGG